MKKVVITVTTGVEFLQPQDEQIVRKAAEWYTKAREALFAHALQQGKVKKAASTLRTLNFPMAPHSRLPDLLTRDVGGILKALKEKRERYLGEFKRWWEEVCRVANEKGSQAVADLKTHVGKLLNLVHQFPWNSPVWDGEAQEAFKNLKEAWAVVRQKDHEQLKIKWRAEVSPLRRPPRIPKFQRLVFNADGRVSGGSKSEALQIEEREDGDLYLRLQLRDPEGIVGGGAYQEVWLRLVVEDEERKQMLRDFSPKYLQLRQDGKRWIAHIVIEREIKFGEQPDYLYGVDIGARKYLLAAVAVPLKPDLPKLPNIAIPSGKFWQAVERVEAEWRKWQRLRTGKKDKEGRVVLKKRTAWRVLKRKRRMRREVAKNMIAEAVNTFINFIKGDNMDIRLWLAIEQIKNLNLSPAFQDRKSRWRQRRWAYRLLLEMLRYKAEWEGIRLIEVNPAHTSQICPRCGKKDGKARQGNRFCCTKCKFQHNADFVAAYNIAVRALKKLGMREEIGWKVLTGKPRVL